MKNIVLWLKEVVAYLKGRLSRRDPKKVACGAWLGRLYSDNSRYFFEWLARNGQDMDVRWIGTSAQRGEFPDDLKGLYLERGSPEARGFIKKAKTWVCCQGWDDIDEMPLYGKATVLNLWHGIPIKQMGDLRSLMKTRPRKSLPVRIRMAIAGVLRPPPKEWTIASSGGMVNLMTGSFPGRFSSGRIVKSGSPRFDWLLAASKNDMLRKRLREKYAKLFGYDPEKRIVLYAPTKRFRPGAGEFAFYALEKTLQEKWKKMLDMEGAVLIEKHHPLSIRQNPPREGMEFPVVVTEKTEKSVSVQELLLAADLLITDYSSIYLDYCLTGKPCIHYIYDYEEYIATDSGLAYDLEKVAGGPLERTLAGLLDRAREALEGKTMARGAEFGSLVEYEKGDACERVAEWMEHIST